MGVSGLSEYTPIHKKKKCYTMTNPVQNTHNINIKFTKFKKGEHWVTGVVNDGEYSFESKLFDEGSIYGINNGRVSKLNISKGTFDNCIVNYDRGWDIEPKTDIDKIIYQLVLDFLENAPKTRF